MGILRGELATVQEIGLRLIESNRPNCDLVRIERTGPEHRGFGPVPVERACRLQRTQNRSVK
jgi:hypothetical protein